MFHRPNQLHRTRRFLLASVTLIVLLIGACGTGVNSEAPPPTLVAQGGPTLRLEPNQGWAGQYVQVVGEGWPANQLIMVFLEDEQGRSGFMAAANSDAEGEVTTGFTWPISERWLQPGSSVQVLASGPDERYTAQTTFAIAQPGAETPTPTPPVTATAASTATPAPTPTIEMQPIASSDIQAPRLQSPPVIDGDLSEWAGVQGYLTPFIVEQHPEWDGSMDVEAVWRLGWDEEALYFGVSIADDQLVQENVPQFAYFGDSLEIELDTDLNADYGPTVNRDDYQYIITPGNFRDLPSAAYRFQGTDEGRLTDAPGTAASVAAQRTDTGYTLEFAIPWSDINLTPHSGLTLGATLSTNDNDVPGSQRTQFLLLSNVAERQWSTPNSWGRLTLR